MQSVYISYSPEDKRAVQLMIALRAMDFLTVEDSHYNPTFVKKIQHAKASKGKVISLDNLWT